MAETKELVDKLDRGEFIKFVENLIVNSDDYKRDNDSNSYVMALDSAWGTGKSYFINLLVQDIEKNCSDISVVKYNAWKNDYCDNAFNPLIFDILNADCLKFSTETDADVETAKKFVKNIFEIGKSFVKKAAIDLVESKTGIDVEEIINDVKKGIDVKEFLHRELPNLSELNEQRIAFGNFKKYLSNATAWMKDKGSKLVVIVDELDRCKPTFAIQTLEIVKHIFDVENIVFLFAVDIEQLSHSISSVYGQGFDSVGYLCRFFDYISKLPNSSIGAYISYQLRCFGYNEGRMGFDELYNFFVKMVNGFNLSLRDIDTVMQNYKVLYDLKLAEYHIIDVHFVYLFYPDLCNWENIRNYTYNEYIYKELENYSLISMNSYKEDSNV